MLVNFIILGAQKCGTTTLFNTLSKHPALIHSVPKEPHFFIKKDFRRKIGEYHKLFHLKEDSLYFEASTSYTNYPNYDLNTHEKIYEYNPEMKFIYIIRNPVDRVISSYMHSYMRGYTDLNIEEAILNKRGLIDQTRYYTQIIPYIRTFGRDQVLILEFNDVVQNTAGTIKEICSFLKIDDSPFTADDFDLHSNRSVRTVKRHHKFDSPSLPLKVIRKFFPNFWEKIVYNDDRKFTSKPELSSDVKKMIINLVELDIIAIGDLTGKDYSSWLKLE